jgi:hypothetical protein
VEDSMMEGTTVLVTIIGVIVSALITLLITMVVGLRNDVDKRDKRMETKVDELQRCINSMVPFSLYDREKEKVSIDLKDHNDRIIRLEIKVHPYGENK